MSRLIGSEVPLCGGWTSRIGSVGGCGGATGVCGGRVSGKRDTRRRIYGHSKVPSEHGGGGSVGRDIAGRLGEDGKWHLLGRRGRAQAASRLWSRILEARKVRGDSGRWRRMAAFARPLPSDPSKPRTETQDPVGIRGPGRGAGSEHQALRSPPKTPSPLP